MTTDRKTLEFNNKKEIVRFHNARTVPVLFQCKNKDKRVIKQKKLILSSYSKYRVELLSLRSSALIILGNHSRFQKKNIFYSIASRFIAVENAFSTSSP